LALLQTWDFDHSCFAGPPDGVTTNGSIMHWPSCSRQAQNVAAKLAGPGTAASTDPAVLAGLTAYKLTPDSPCIGAGIIIKDNGGRDFWGNPVPESRRPAVGACEKP